MLTKLLEAECLFFLLVGAALFSWKCVTGHIDCRRLIIDPKTGLPSIGRAQLLLISAFGATSYLIGDLTHPGSMPQIPGALIAAFGLSHAAYHLDAFIGRKSGLSR